MITVITDDPDAPLVCDGCNRDTKRNITIKFIAKQRFSVLYLDLCYACLGTLSNKLAKLRQKKRTPWATARAKANKP